MLVSTRASRTAVSLIALLGVGLIPSAARASVRLPGHVPFGAVAESRPIGRLAGATPLSVAITLPLRNQAALSIVLHRLYDPGDSLYGHYLTPEQFASEFGPTVADYNAVISLARSHGLEVTGTHPNRLVLDVAGPASAIESTFDVHLMAFQSPDGRVFHAPDNDPAIPDSLAGRILGVVGLDNAFLEHTHSRAVPADAFAGPLQIGTGPGSGLAPQDIRTAYNLSGVSASGSGQTLGLFELDGYTPSDISAYESYFGIPAVPLQNVLVDGASGGAGSNKAEVTLDIELQAAIATGASKIMVYEGPNSSAGVIDTYNRIATDNLAKEISTSWGLAEKSNSSSALSSENSIFAQMEAQGQSLFAASGDSGAYDNGSTLSVDDPASQPNVTGVGGTQLSVNVGETYSSETTWNVNGTVSAGAGGGGVSVVWAIPSYQQGVISPTSSGSTTHRNVPDVSLNADQYSGYSIYVGGRWNIYGGTSCAAPLWSAFAALVNQQRLSNGSSYLGFANPSLYTIATGSAYSSDFHDIADGSTNLYYPAVTGYDDATGWGSFNGANLLAGLAPAGSVTIPAAPTNLAAAAGNGAVSLTWTASAGASSYNVKRSVTSGTGYTTVGTSTTTGYQDTTVTNGTTYYYVVTAVNSAGESANSNGAAATPQVSPAAAPTNLAAVAGDASVSLSWTASAGATSYNIKQSTTSGGPYTTVGSSSGASFVISGLTNGVTYYFVVTAVNSAGESGNSNQASATPAAVALAISSGPTESTSKTTANIQWSTNVAATSVVNYGKTSSLGTTYSSAALVTSHAVGLSGLSRRTTYYYTVSSSENGSTVTSAVHTFTTH